MSKPFLQVERLTQRYPAARGQSELVVFEDLSFGVQKGELCTIIGHSGCGKSTILSAMAGLTRPSGGHVFVNGRAVEGPSISRGVVFQNHSLLPWKTALENVAFSVRARFPEWNRGQVREHSLRYLRQVGLQGGAEQRRPAQLSGGMRQRVGIARAFAIKPEVLLMDEPFGALDALTRATVQDQLIDLWRASGLTVFMITHDIDEAIYLSDRVLLMSEGPRARLIDTVPIPLPRPRDRARLFKDPRYYQVRARLVDFLHGREVAASHSKEVTVNAKDPTAMGRGPTEPIEKERIMTKREMSEAVLAAKKAKGLTWAKLAESVGLGEVWLASCGHGENCLQPDAAEKLAMILGLGPEVRAALCEPPLKGWSMEKPVPTDPLIYRFYEIVAVYGTTIKDVIQEKFGYGIMSAIDFKMEIEKEENPKGDRVVVKLNGKFLPYTKW